MKVILSVISVFLLVIAPVTVSAVEVLTSGGTVNGDYTFQQEYDLNGSSSVSTTNVDGNTKTFDFYLTDEYGSIEGSAKNISVDNDETYTLSKWGMSPGSRGAEVKTGSDVSHQPKFNS